MVVTFQQTSSFREIREQIEQHLYDSVLELEKNAGLALRAVEQFGFAIDRLMDTLEQMYQSPGPKDTFGEKSSPIHKGRYRVFFKLNIRSSEDFDITFLDIDDNKQSNLDRFPSHRIITYDDEG